MKCDGNENISPVNHATHDCAWHLASKARSKAPGTPLVCTPYQGAQSPACRHSQQICGKPMGRS